MSISNCHNLSLFLPGEPASEKQIKIIWLPGIRARKLDRSISSGYRVWWVTLSLFRNLSSKWNRHSSCQLSVFPNRLCPGVDWEDIIFPKSPVWLTRQMTQVQLQNLGPSFNKPSALASQRLKVLLKLSWAPCFYTRKLRSGDVWGSPLAALDQRQNPSHLFNLMCSPR